MEQVPVCPLAPLQLDGYDLSLQLAAVAHPVQCPAVHVSPPVQLADVVHVFEHVPRAPPLHTSVGPQSASA
jgi:hypothetical protein